MFFTGILNNITLMLALCFFYRLIARHWKIDTLTGKVLAGLLFGGMAVIGMLFPVTYSSGLIFDGRTILLSVIGFYGGLLPAAIAVAMTGMLRIWQGGVGMWMGIGTIFSSALIGILYNHLRVLHPWLTRPIYMYVFGIFVHIAMLLCTGLLPVSLQWQVLGNIAVPVLVVYPVATMFYGLLLVELEERDRANNALQENEAKLQAMFDHASLFIALLTPAGRLQSANRSILHFIGCEEAMIVGLPFWEAPQWSGRIKEQDDVRAAVMEAAKGHFTRQEIICISQNNEEQIHDLSIKPVFNEEKQVVYLIAEGWDISKRKMMEEQLRQKTEEIQGMAYSDILTGLPNRAQLNRQLTAEMERARCEEASGSILFIDLDDLKIVNDTFGHTSGDDVIIKAGMNIMAAAEGKSFVARISGDEFIVILPGESNRERVANIADRIIGALCQEYDVGGAYFNMSASAGVAVYPEDGDTAEDILKNADNALYAAKKVGKNCWCFYEKAMQAEAYEKMLLTNSLRNAANRGELVLHYQPQVVADSGAIVGFEALLRWNSPEYGFVPPDRFIPLAEKYGLIRSIGQWVLREACLFARCLANLGWGELHIAVNVSARQLTDPGFIDSVRCVLDEVGIEPRQLELEITESVLLTSLEDITGKLAELHALGVRLSLDDFGTGYSSLTYLQRLPVDTLKIDKSFIDIILMNTLQPAIIGLIIDMAHILKMTVVAEGVEKEQQLEYLVRKQCDLVQGYLVSRPVPENEAIRFLSRQAT